LMTPEGVTAGAALSSALLSTVTRWSRSSELSCPTDGSQCPNFSFSELSRLTYKR
jgi:hypothetical protein